MRRSYYEQAYKDGLYNGITFGGLLLYFFIVYRDGDFGWVGYLLGAGAFSLIFYSIRMTHRKYKRADGQ